MIIRITYPYKSSINKIETKNIYIQTDDEELIHELHSTNNPIDIGIILSQNEGKYKLIEKQKDDFHIIIEEVLNNPNLI